MQKHLMEATMENTKLNKRFLQKQKTMSLLIEAAIPIFEEKGFEGANITEITDQYPFHLHDGEVELSPVFPGSPEKGFHYEFFNEGTRYDYPQTHPILQTRCQARPCNTAF